MSRARLLFGAFAALLAIGCAAGPQVVIPTTPSPRADRPAYTLGEKWIRADGFYELVKITDDTYTFSTPDGREIELSKDLVILRVGRRYRVPTWEFGPAPPLPWPLEVGKRGSTRGRWQRLEALYHPAGLQRDYAAGTARYVLPRFEYTLRIEDATLT